jgi:hypothetical protein
MKRSLFAVPLLCLASLGLAEAETIYVATNGSDVDPCGAVDDPCQTIAKATNNLMNGGDTVRIMAGTYAEIEQLEPPAGASWDAPSVVMANPGDTVVIAPNAPRVFYFGDERRFIVVDGLVMDGGNATTGVDYTVLTISSASLGHIRIQNSELKNGPSESCILVGAEHNEFINLNVHDCGSGSGSHGIYISAKNNLVERSRFHDNPGSGIHLYSGAGGTDKTSGNVVRHCKTYDNGSSGIVLWHGTGTVAADNVSYGNGTKGIAVASAKDVWLTGNYCFGNDVGLLIESDATDTVALNNIIIDNTVNVDDDSTSTLPPVST